MQLLLLPVYADDLRSCLSSDLLIQSGCASRHKESARESPEGSHLLAVCPAYGNPMLYLHSLPRRLPRQSNRRSKEHVRNEDKESLICKRRMTKELRLAVPLPKYLIFSLFSLLFSLKIPLSSRQSHSQFPLAPVS